MTTSLLAGISRKVALRSPLAPSTTQVGAHSGDEAGLPGDGLTPGATEGVELGQGACQVALVSGAVLHRGGGALSVGFLKLPRQSTSGNGGFQKFGAALLLVLDRDARVGGERGGERDQLSLADDRAGQ